MHLRGYPILSAIQDPGMQALRLRTMSRVPSYLSDALKVRHITIAKYVIPANNIVVAPVG
jgi:hypothetical protein